ncbi:MAG: PQQ-binding-like beta-propeller repeat protein [Polyangiaceae bacterium]|nr:PQQ-binding-like beta-propeller repeat protein [Polyangiaceae bacterium]
MSRTPSRTRKSLVTPFAPFTFVVFATFASACGADVFAGDRTNPAVPLWYARPNGAMSVFVRRTLTAPSRTVGEDWERGRPEIDSARNRVFVGSSDHGLYALRAGDGSTIWRFETLAVVQSEPLYDSEMDYVYFGSNDGALYCVRAQTGKLVYRFDTGAEVSRKPVRAGENLFFSNAADFLFSIDRRTGKQNWQVHRTPALGMEISGHAGPAYDPASNLVFMAYSDGHVIAYSGADGSEKWSPVDLSADAEQAGGEAPRYLDVDTTPVLDDSPQGRVVYVASYAAGVYALDATTGSRAWANDKVIGVTDLLLWKERAHMPNPNGPDRGGPMVPERKLIVVSSAAVGLTALDTVTGRVVWQNKVPEGGITAPAALAGALFVGTSRYGAFLLSPRNGKVIDGIDFGTGFSQTPAAYGNRAYVMTNAGTFLGVSVAPPLPLAHAMYSATQSR